MSTTTPAGWYRDPEGAPVLRYWDGQQWTDATDYPYVEPRPEEATPAVVVPTTRLKRDQQARPIQIPLAWILAVLTVGYMLPWAVAATRRKSNAGAIGLLNLLLGWTVVGWIVALVMACSAHQTAAVTDWRKHQGK